MLFLTWHNLKKIDPYCLTMVQSSDQIDLAYSSLKSWKMELQLVTTVAEYFLINRLAVWLLDVIDAFRHSIPTLSFPDKNPCPLSGIMGLGERCSFFQRRI